MLGIALAVLAILALCPRAGRAEGHVVITAWNYYQHPPFLCAAKEGLAPEFIRLLNDMSRGKYRFSLVNLPRKRVDQYLEFKEPGIVLFVNWIWMDDADRTKYHWSQTLLSDRNEILSNAAAPIDYRGVHSLYGKLLGGVPGRRYQGIDKAVAQGRLYRQDSPSTEQNLEKLLLRRIDFLTAPRSILRCLIKEHKCGEQVYFSPEPLIRFTRHILVPRYMPDVFAQVKETLGRLLDSPEWARLKGKYLVD